MVQTALSSLIRCLILYCKSALSISSALVVGKIEDLIAGKSWRSVIPRAEKVIRASDLARKKSGETWPG